MYTEERIFGPLTFKQFVCAAAGVGLFFVLETRIPENYRVVAIIVIAIATIASIFRFKPKKIGDINEYFAVQKSALEPTAYQRLLQMKHAEVLSQIHMRKQKGIPDDHGLLSMAELLEKMIGEDENK